MNFSVLVTSCDLKFKKSAFDIWEVPPIGFDFTHTTVDRRIFRKPVYSPFDSRRQPCVCVFFLGPSCWVSTLWLSSSKWLARGGRRFRCVDFCALHWQCLPKTVKLSRLHCCLDICLTWSLWHVPVLLNIWWWRTNNFFESGMWRARSRSLSFNCAGLCSAVKNGGVPGN